MCFPDSINVPADVTKAPRAESAIANGQLIDVILLQSIDDGCEPLLFSGELTRERS